MSDHELRYRAATSGLARRGIADNAQPHWFCTCGGWRKDRNGRGQPFEEGARRLHAKHVREAAS